MRSVRARRTTWLAERLRILEPEELAAVDAAMPALLRLVGERLVTALVIALRTRTFRSLRRHRNYRIFFGGQLVSLAGTWMQNVALAWLVLELSELGARRRRARVLALRALHGVRLVAAGVLADRFDSRRLVMTTQAAAMVVSIALAIVTLTGHGDPAHRLRAGGARRDHARVRRPRPAVADVPDGRAAVASERRRPERRALQRLSRHRAGDRGRDHRDGRDRRSASRSTP